ncbi:MAG: GspE/PulE family protein [Gemmatimonadetes bacterium]|nr:GspE/PulE family protein [Gemmatimonadota bacterium]
MRGVQMFRSANGHVPETSEPTPEAGSGGTSEEMAEFELVPGLSRAYLLHHRVCPLGFSESGALRVAVTEGTSEEALDDLGIAYLRVVETEAEDEATLGVLIERLVSGGEEEGVEIEPFDELDGDFAPDIRDLANQPPVVRYVNLIVREAHEAGASDIHLEQSRTAMQARVRIDGRLVASVDPPPGMGAAVVSRIKLLAELDIAERRRPQDGRIRVRTGKGDLDLRVSTVPTLHGESVVMRLLQRSLGPIDLAGLGMPRRIERPFRAVARKPHGMVLVTGPTGSGKTTTLYSALRLRDRESEKILTVEDPVEYELDDVAQVPVRRAAGLTFAAALRSLLRQDPDVMLIGEMRDEETAEIAIQAALTGHFVFSTLHTNDALGAIPRLRDLGVPSFLIAATVDGVLAQRLARRVCSTCSAPYTPRSPVLRARLERSGGDFRKGRGCDRCRGTGYRGRVGIFEWLAISDEMRESIGAEAPDVELEGIALAGGFRRLTLDGWTKIKTGQTTLEEVIRVTQT